MTTADLIKQLGKAHEIGGLTSGPLAAHRTVRYAIADVLKATLPGDAVVVDGLELNRETYDDSKWHGQTEWVLMYKSFLLHVKVEISGPNRQELKLEHRKLPLSRIQSVVLTTEHQEQANDAYLKSVGLVVRFSNTETVDVSATLPDQKAHKILSFAQHLNAR